MDSTSNLKINISGYLCIALSILFFSFDIDNTEYATLKNRIDNSKDKNEMFSLYLEIGDLFEFTDQQRALQYYYQAKSLCEKQDPDDSAWIENSGLCERYIGLIYYYQSEYDTALSYFFSSLKHYQKVKNHQQISAAYNNIGMVQHAMKNINTAAEYYLQSKIHAELVSDSIGIGRAMVNLGIIYQLDDDFDASIQYYEKALPIFRAKSAERELAATHNNIGNIYAKKAKEAIEPDSTALFYDKASENYNYTKDILEKQNDIPGLSTALGNIAQIYVFRSQLESLAVSAADSYRIKAIEYGLKSINLSESINDLYNVVFAAYSVYEAHKNMGNADSAYFYLHKIINSQEKLFEENMAVATTEMEAIYQNEQKQQEIERQKILAQRRTIVNLALTVLTGLLIILSITLYINFNNKRKSNRLINEKNLMLEQANAEILAQRDEIERQHNLVVLQKGKIEFVYQQLMDSMYYAQNIHESLFPKIENFTRYFSEHAIIYKPKEIVSGDFYRFFEKGDDCLIAVADCTGHGVPGSMMSLLGMILLNQAIVEEGETRPPVILKKLAEGFVSLLNSGKKDYHPVEGMEIALCKFNKRTGKLQFSGAKGLLWIDTGLEIKAIKGSNISLSAKLENSLPNLSFDMKEETIKPGDSLYLFTDGYIDQMNTSNKRIGSKNLLNLTIDNRSKTLDDLKITLDDYLQQHMGEESQIDDITWMGLRV